MAEQLGEQFRIKDRYTDARELLKRAQPNIVHITTPPESHLELGKLCLEAGCHVLVEKPFTLCADDADRLITLARSRNLKLTVNHNCQFSPAAIRIRQLVNEGFLGSRVVHLDSFFCYDFGSATYARRILADPRHWVRRLPGQLLHNIISHGIGQIAEYLASEPFEISAQGSTSQFLKSLGETEIIDELRVFIRDNRNTTAYFTFSSQMKPKLHEFRLFGDENGLILDDDHQAVVRLYGHFFKGPLNQILPSLGFARQHAGNAWRNVIKFLKADLHSDARTRLLIEAFYRAVTEDAPLPIPHREILATAKLMDEIFRQVYRTTPVASNALLTSA